MGVWASERDKVKNAKFAQRLSDAAKLSPMNHWSALSAIKPVLASNPDVILINEGANTLDDTRDTIDMTLPRHRIDCATWANYGHGNGVFYRSRSCHRKISRGY